MRKLFFSFFICTFSLNSFSSEFFDNAKEDALSPFSTDAVKIFGVGSVLTLLTLSFNDTFKKDFQESVTQERPLKKYSKWGDFLGRGVPNMAYALFMGGSYLIYDDQKSLDRVVLMTKASLYSGAMTDLMKITFRQTRPNGSKYSFPSGHTTTAFAFSSVVAMEHSLPWGIAANALAAFVGFSRINDNAHYLHDVLAGATIGAMYGVGVYKSQEIRQQKKAQTATFMLIPLQDGLAANTSLSF